ncbi:MAG TPA: DUF202 domain-containing protein [Allosphingosinicella sp.]
MNHVSPRFEVEPNAGNHLAWVNAVLSLQRTLMAAVRTAVTLIAFGFTVARVLGSMQSAVPPEFLILGHHLPRNLGLLMIAAGVGSLGLFTWQYLRAVAYLAAEPFDGIALRITVPLHHLTCFTAYAVMLLGVLGFASVLLGV